MSIIWYSHHDQNVAVMEKLKGKHREHCLCFKCDKFHPGTIDNCPIAQATFENCVKYGTTTPVYECPKFKPSDLGCVEGEEGDH